MLLYKKRKDIVTHFKYLKTLLKAYFIPINKKVIYIDISTIQINRYLAALLQMLSMQGYTIFVPASKKIIKILNNSNGEFRYASWLLSDKLIKFGTPNKIITGKISIPAYKLSNDYFSDSDSDSDYHVPMCCYPAFYKQYELLKKVDPYHNERKRSIFMAGNFDDNYYNRIDDSTFFNQPSRRKVVDFLKEKEYYNPLNSISYLNNYILGEKENNVILIDTKTDFRIPFTSLLSYLINFDFFLALPGITIPQSHNLIEAMACGCIPIIHHEYAELMQPPLEHHKNALIFSDLDDLDKIISKTFSFSDDFVNTIRQNVVVYFSKFLSPEAITSIIVNPKIEKIYIQAEHFSLLEKRKREFL